MMSILLFGILIVVSCHTSSAPSSSLLSVAQGSGRIVQDVGQAAKMTRPTGIHRSQLKLLSTSPQHRRIDGSWLRACNASRVLWRGLALRDVNQGTGRRHDLVTLLPKYNLIFLYVPKVASSSGRAYAKRLDNNSIEAMGWNEALIYLAETGRTNTDEEKKIVTFALTRDPLERFVSASGTLAHRIRGDAWDTKGLKLVQECVSNTEKFAQKNKVGRYSYAAAAQHARCSLAITEHNGLFWNHHIAPQLSYYAILNDNTTLIQSRKRLPTNTPQKTLPFSTKQRTQSKSNKVEWMCSPAPSIAASRPARCVHQPSVVHAMPMRDPVSGISLVQRSWDRAARLTFGHGQDEPKRKFHSSFHFLSESTQSKIGSYTLPHRISSYANVQEGRWRILDYAYLLDKLGPGFQRRICRLYRDDYVCLQLTAPYICRDIPGFENHPYFADPDTKFGKHSSLEVPDSDARPSQTTTATTTTAKSPL